MRKLILLVCSVILSLSAFAQTDKIFYTSTDGNIVTPYETDVFGVNIISNEYKDGQGIITFDGPVKSVGEDAFYFCKSLTSITIPEGVTSIGRSAFAYCSSLTTVTLPEGVTSIEDNTFHYCSSLTAITIPEGVTSIGENAFYFCKSLTALTIPEGVTNIGDNTFQYCSSLTAITIPEGATSIGAWAFSGCSSLTAITIPNTVTSIGTFAFSKCSSLPSITIPEGVTSIEGCMFSGCSSLTTITIPESVTSIGSSAFEDCSSLTSIVVESGNTIYDSRENCNAIIETATNTLVAGCKSTIIPNTVTSIGAGAFQYCSSLTSITIPNSVTSIGGWAFYGSSLTSINIPNSVTSIGSSTFSSCSSLTSIVVESGNTIYDSRENCNAIIETATNTLIAGCKSTIIPSTVTRIGSSAFSNCKSLSSITVPISVTTIGSFAFSGCSSLATITISGVTSIGIYAFDGCSSLPSITIPNTLTSIGDWAFSGCSSLTSVTIPKGVTSIGGYAFSYCSKLGIVHAEATTPPTLGSDAFNSSPVCIIPCGAKAAYEESDWAAQAKELVEDCIYPAWQILYTSTDSNIVTPYKTDVFGANIISNEYKDGQGIITFDGPVTSIGQEAFYRCSSLASITIPDSVTSIGEKACDGCSSLTTITIPSGVTSIGEKACDGCSSLTTITIPSGVTSIGECVFASCSSLTSIVVESGNTIYDSRENCNAIIETATNSLIAGCKSTIIPNTVTNIGNYAFCRCDSLASITIPEGVTNIGTSAFAGCSSLTSITIPNSVTSIGEYAFYQCSSLTSITIPEGVTSIENYTFQYCSSLIAITIPEGVTNIGTSTFSSCSSLTSITIPEGVTSIGNNAFSGCSSLTSITIPEGVTNIGTSTFSSCSSLTSITIPEGVTSIGNNAFSGCSSLTSITIPEGVTSIGRLTFSNCSSLIAITISESVTSIGIQAFRSCSKLDTVYVKATTPPTLGSTTFTSSPVCIIPCGTKAVYESSDWGRYVRKFVVSEQFEIVVYSSNDTWGTVTIELPTPSQGIGNFSVSAYKQVTFSPGNLQYHPKNEEWRFAPSQTDYIGDANSNISSTYNGWIDLFGWSTSSTNFGVSTSTDPNSYSGSFVDWGTNKIGDDDPYTWRTLNSTEWNYLLSNRNNASSLCGVAQVNGVNGLILLPDNWTCPEGVTFKSGIHSNTGVDYYAAYQTFTAEQWAKLEAAGAVFLPAAGGRNGSDVYDGRDRGLYWSSTQNSSMAIALIFSSAEVDRGNGSRHNGLSVRLARTIYEQ